MGFMLSEVATRQALPNVSVPPAIIIPHVQSALYNLHQRFSMFRGLRCADNFFFLFFFEGEGV